MEELFEFLNDLRDNNNREWMQVNKDRYRMAKSIFHDFMTDLIEDISAFDKTVTDLEAKDCVFGLNRDIRFSKNKIPYKTNFGAAIMEGGRKSPNPTYYVHLEPGKSFVAGGLYMPESEVLKKIRQEIDYNSGELRAIIQSQEFKDAFGQMTGEKLKTAPKGYPKDHPNIDLLRMKSFLVSKELTDKEVLDEQFRQKLYHYFKVIHPFNNYFLVAITETD